MLLVRIAHVAQRRTHVERAARLALVQHVVTAQVNLGGLASGSATASSDRCRVFPFSFFSLQTVCALVIRLGTAMVSVADMLLRIVAQSVLSVFIRGWFSESHQQNLAPPAGTHASLEHASHAHALHRHGRRASSSTTPVRSCFSNTGFAPGSGWGLPGGFLERVNSQSTHCAASCAKRLVGSGRH